MKYLIISNDLKCLDFSLNRDDWHHTNKSYLNITDNKFVARGRVIEDINGLLCFCYLEKSIFNILKLSKTFYYPKKFVDVKKLKYKLYAKYNSSNVWFYHTLNKGKHKIRCDKSNDKAIRPSSFVSYLIKKYKKCSFNVVDDSDRIALLKNNNILLPSNNNFYFCWGKDFFANKILDQKDYISYIFLGPKVFKIIDGLAFKPNNNDELLNIAKNIKKDIGITFVKIDFLKDNSFFDFSIFPTLPDIDILNEEHEKFIINKMKMIEKKTLEKGK
jgi:hypothetical protein